MNDYDKGVADCKAGAPPKAGMTDLYYCGYGDQYQVEAMMDNKTGIQ